MKEAGGGGRRTGGEDEEEYFDVRKDTCGWLAWYEKGDLFKLRKCQPVTTRASCNYERRLLNTILRDRC